MFKSLVLAVGLLLGVSSAQAASIGNVEVVPGSASYSGTGTFSSNGSGGFNFGAIVPAGFDQLLINANDLGFLASTLPSGALLSAGAPEDIAATSTSLQVLYRATFNNLDPDYGLALLTISGLPGDPLTTAFQVPLPTTFTLEAVREVSAIPLPASLPLVLSAFAGIALLGRRRKASA